MLVKGDPVKRMAIRLMTLLLPRPLVVKLRTERQYRIYTRAHRQGRRRAHDLAGMLLVSLTSFPPRYPTLHLTLKSLLRQDTQPDLIVLWIARQDEQALPPAVRKLFGKGIELRIVEDVRSYKKLVFALQDFPSSYIVTADDDVFYKPDWLTLLVAGQRPGERVITCHRGHRLKQTTQGGLAKYADWGWDVDDDRARCPSVDLMPTGVGGVLYPPGSLHPDATARALYERYTPSADDLWFFWCARRAGSTYRKVGPKFRQLGWWSSQESRLFDANIVLNDEQVAQLEHRFGNPLAMPVACPPTGAASAS